MPNARKWLAVLLTLAVLTVPAVSSAAVFTTVRALLTTSAGTPIVGARAELATIPAVFALSDATGLVTISIPAGVNTVLKFTAAGYTTTFSATINATAFTDLGTYTLYTPAEITLFGTLATKSYLRGTVRSAADLPLAGATVKAASTLHPATPYVVDYGAVGAISTGATGDFAVINVDPGDTVTISATLVGTTFPTLIFPATVAAVAYEEPLRAASATTTVTGTISTSAAAIVTGAAVHPLNNQAVTALTDINGLFTLAVPGTAPFALVANAVGFLPLYAYFDMNQAGLADAGNLTAYTAAEVAAWKISAGKSVIRGQAIDQLDLGVTGATVVATSMLNPATPYVVDYSPDGLLAGGATTGATGTFFVRNVTAGDTVTLQVSSATLVFPPLNITAVGNAVHEPILRGAPAPPAAVRPLWLSVRAAAPGGTTGASWGPSATAGATYVLEEAYSPTFAGSTVAYSGPNTSVNLTGRSVGTYYYRVKAVATGFVDSAWVVGANPSVVPGTVSGPAWISVRATTSTGVTGAGWGTSTTAGASYVLQESTSATFATPKVVYTGTATSVNLTGRNNGTYYYRVKAVRTGAPDSAWTTGATGCVVSGVTPVGRPAWISVRAAATGGTTGAGWGASATPGATYILEEDTTALFAAPQTVYTGTATTINLPGHARGSYYYRVKAIKTNMGDSGWTTGATPSVVP